MFVDLACPSVSPSKISQALEINFWINIDFSSIYFKSDASADITHFLCSKKLQVRMNLKNRCIVNQSNAKLKQAEDWPSSGVHNHKIGTFWDANAGV